MDVELSTAANSRPRPPWLQSHKLPPELQVLVYDVLPPTTALIDDAMVLGKLSANGECSGVGAQMAVSL